MALFGKSTWRLRRRSRALSVEFHRFIKTEFGLRIRNERWYTEAMTHASMSDDLPEGEQPNERLEFLGDSVLGTVAAELVFFRFPEVDEGPLTQKRSKLVSRKTLNRVGEAMGLGQYIRSRIGKSPLPSTVVGNALEALVGALYLDHGYKKTRAAVSAMLLRYGAEVIMEEAADFKSRMHHWAQVEGVDLRYMGTEDSVGDRTAEERFVVTLFIGDREIAKGLGRSKKAAEQAAARKALERGEWRENAL